VVPRSKRCAYHGYVMRLIQIDDLFNLVVSLADALSKRTVVRDS